MKKAATKKFTIALLSLILMGTVGCTSKKLNAEVGSIPQPTVTSKQLIKVNGSVITQEMFDEMMKVQVGQAFGTQQINLNDPKNKLIGMVFKDKAINELIVKQLLEQEVKKRNLEATPTEINEYINKLSQKVGGKQKLDAMLALQKVDENKFKESVKSDICLKKLVNTLGVTKVSDSEIKKFYDKNKTEKFTTPDLVRAQHILVMAPADDIAMKIKNEKPSISASELKTEVQAQMDSLKAKAQKIALEAKAKPEKFPALASKYSEDYSSAKNGGDLGFFQKKDMVKEFSDAAFSMKPDTVSDVIKTAYGYHVIKVIDRKKAGITPFNEVAPTIKKYLEDQKKIEVLQKLVNGLKTTAKIEYLDPGFDSKKIEAEITAQVKKQNLNKNQPIQLQAK